MNYFSICGRCEMPIAMQVMQSKCPYCKAKLDNSAYCDSGYSNMLEEYRETPYWSSEMIGELLDVLEFLIDCNNRTSVELGKALINLHKTKRQLEWYRKHIGPRST